MGYLYRPKLKSGGPSSVWWAKYYVNGKAVRESTRSEKETDAKRFLKEREGRAATGKPIIPRADRIRYDEVAKDLEDYYTATGKRDLREARFRLAHLKQFFGGYRAAAIGPSEITRYVVQRQAAEAANGTINRELATLSRMLRLGYAAGKVLRPPVIVRLKESAPRQGFFDEEKYQAIRRHLLDDLQAATLIAYTYGWRIASEVLPLERRQLDLKAGTLRLDAGTTKNGDGRIVYLTAEVELALREQVERVRALEKQVGQIIPYLFPHLDGDERGRPRRDIRSAWATACKRAGCPGMLPHDFRRTAVRNMERAGVPRSVAMKLTGHRTEAIYKRYAIVSDTEIRDAAKRLTGTFSGTFGVSSGSPVR
jgi:integrase